MSRLNEWLVAEAVTQPVRQFVQLDGFGRDQCDSVIHADENGYGMLAGMVYELRATDILVRIQINPSADRETVRALLEKAMGWVSDDWETLQKMTAYDPSQPKPEPADGIPF